MKIKRKKKIFDVFFFPKALIECKLFVLKKSPEGYFVLDNMFDNIMPPMNKDDNKNISTRLLIKSRVSWEGKKVKLEKV